MSYPENGLSLRMTVFKDNERSGVRLSLNVTVFKDNERSGVCLSLNVTVFKDKVGTGSSFFHKSECYFSGLVRLLRQTP